MCVCVWIIRIRTYTYIHTYIHTCVPGGMKINMNRYVQNIYIQYIYNYIRICAGNVCVCSKERGERDRERRHVSCSRSTPTCCRRPTMQASCRFNWQRLHGPLSLACACVVVLLFFSLVSAIACSGKAVSCVHFQSKENNAALRTLSVATVTTVCL